MSQIGNSREQGPLPLPSRRPDEEFQTLSSAIRVEFAARSHPGGRPTNEDHYLILEMGRHQATIATSLPAGEVPARFDEAGYGIAVADGMGAGETGEKASRLAISTLAYLALHYSKWNVRIDARTADEVMARGLRYYRSIDERVTEASLESPGLTGMGTTLTVAYIASDALFIAHVGHSRAYLLRNRMLTNLTRDQTLAQHLDAGGRAPVDLAAHDLGHILTDAIGGHAGAPSIQISQFRLEADDSLMLCTNGLTDVVDDESSATILVQSQTLDERCGALVDLALARGATDNVTAVLASYSIPGGPVRGSVTHL